MMHIYITPVKPRGKESVAHLAFAASVVIRFRRALLAGDELFTLKALVSTFLLFLLFYYSLLLRFHLPSFLLLFSKSTSNDCVNRKQGYM